ncbi:MAG: VOC family protein, partial [Candidatus Korobacteraceae bacterium]
MQVVAYLNFPGTCEEAFKFYEQCIGAKFEFFRHEGTPMAEHVPPEWQKKIMHATLRMEDGVLMGSDAPPDHYQKPQGFAVALQMKDPAQAEKVFSALSEKGQIQMPLQETFWAARVGMLVD